MRTDRRHRLRARPLEARGRALRLACLLVVAGVIAALSGCVPYAVDSIRAPDEHARSIVTADFDGDGVTDALVGYEVTTYAGVSLVKQDAFGLWEHRAPDSLAWLSELMAVTDLSGDGIPDVVGAAPGFAGIQPLRGRGDGTFEAGGMMLLSGDATALTAARSSSGVQLVAVAHEQGATRRVSIYRALSGALEHQFDLTRGGATARELALHDVTGDGWLDLLVGTADGKVEVYPATNATGTIRTDPTVLTASGHSAPVVALAAGDVATPFHPDLNARAREWTADGHADVLAAFDDGDAIVAWRGTGGGGFATGVDVMDRAATSARLVSLRIDPQGSGAWGGLIRSNPGNAGSKPKAYVGDDNELAIVTVDVACDVIDAAPVPLGQPAVLFGSAMVCSDGQVKVALPQVKRLRVSPHSFDFGAQRVGTASEYRSPDVFELVDDALLTSSLLLGPDAGDFTLREDCSPSGRCVPEVSFTPRSRGVKHATVRVLGSYYTPGGRPHEIELTGTAIGSVASAPAAVDLGEVEVGSTASASLRVTNDGDAPLNVEEVSFTGSAPGWTAGLGTCDEPVDPGDWCSVDVSFTPAQAGAASATLRVDSDSVGAAPTVTLTADAVSSDPGGGDPGDGGDDPGDGGDPDNEGDPGDGGGSGDDGGRSPAGGGSGSAGGGGSGSGATPGPGPAGGDRPGSPTRTSRARARLTVRASARTVARRGRREVVLRVVARNVGDRVARAVTLRLPLPRGLRLAPARAGRDGPRERGGHVIVRLGQLAAGRGRSLSLRLRLTRPVGRRALPLTVTLVGRDVASARARVVARLG